MKFPQLSKTISMSLVVAVFAVATPPLETAQASDEAGQCASVTRSDSDNYYFKNRCSDGVYISYCILSSPNYCDSTYLSGNSESYIGSDADQHGVRIKGACYRNYPSTDGDCH